jgi:hypothetical protein
MAGVLALGESRRSAVSTPSKHYHAASAESPQRSRRRSIFAGGLRVATCALPACLALFGLLLIANALATGIVLEKCGTFASEVEHFGVPSGHGRISNQYASSELRLTDGSAYWFERDNFTPSLRNPYPNEAHNRRVDVWYTYSLLPPFHPALAALQTYDDHGATATKYTSFGYTNPGDARNIALGLSLLFALPLLAIGLFLTWKAWQVTAPHNVQRLARRPTIPARSATAPRASPAPSPPAAGGRAARPAHGSRRTRGKRRSARRR